MFTDLSKELIELKPPFDYFSEQLMELKFNDNETGRMFIKYVLGRINDALAQTRENSINFYQVNIEHLLPQQPDKEWHLKKSDIKLYVNLLGNLTLLDKEINSKIGNGVMESKIKELQTSTLPITKHVVQFITDHDMKWNEDQIYLRQEELADLAYKKVWTF